MLGCRGYCDGFVCLGNRTGRDDRDLTEADIRAKFFRSLAGPMLIVIKKDIKSGKLQPSDEFLTMLGIERKRE